MADDRQDSYPLEEKWLVALEHLEEDERTLERRISRDALAYAGLRDVDDTLALVRTRVDIVLTLIEAMEDRSSAVRERLSRTAGTKARQALRMFQELEGAGISEDQRRRIGEEPAYRETKQRLQELLLAGGAGYLESELRSRKDQERLALIVTGAFAKYLAPDDRYQPLFRTESLPTVLRRIVGLFFPALAPENHADPPYGIEEGEERTYTSDRIRMPLSQAAHYYRNELLPALERSLDAQPGNVELQSRIREIREWLDEYGSTRLVPRSTPIVLERNFYTDAFSRYTPDGEPLVSVAVSVRFLSGTNLDRMRELVQTQIVKAAAGEGLCSELDREYRYLKSMDSGIRGSSLRPSLKLDPLEGFRMLEASYPSLRRLESRREFRRIAEVMSSEGRKAARRHIEELIRHTPGGREETDGRPPLLG